MLINFVKPNLSGAAYDIIDGLSERMVDDVRHIVNIDDVKITDPKRFLYLITHTSNSVQVNIPKPDIWHVYDWKYYLPFMELQPTVLMFHGVFIFNDLNALDAWECFVMYYQHYAYKNATRILAASNYVAEEIKKVFGNRDIDITGFGVDERKFTPLGLEKKYDIVIAAPYKRVKRIDWFIELAKQLHITDRSFIAGQEIPDEPNNKLIANMIRESGIKSKYIPYNKMPNFYNIAKVYVQPSLSETWGLAVTEAMSCGIPVVCTDAGGMREQITNGIEGFLCSSIDEMADRVKYLLENPDEAAAMGLNGRKKVMENFTMDRYSQKIRNVYENCRIVKQ